jgi:hypothetical protein
MKYFLTLMMISTVSWAQADQIKIEKIRSIDYEDNEATITFWGTNRVHRMPANNKNIPCLDNAHKSEMEVALVMKQDSDVIEDCKLYNGGVPNFK